jgi:hypothetical protein
LPACAGRASSARTRPRCGSRAGAAGTGYAQVVIHVIRPSRGRAVVDEVLGGHRPPIWVSDLLAAAQRGHADEGQVCLAHQLRDLRHAIEAGDAVFAPRLKALVLRAVLLARRRSELKASTPGGNTAVAWSGTWTRFWRCSRATASGCASATLPSAAACAPSSSIPRHRPTTTAANAISGRW